MCVITQDGTRLQRFACECCMGMGFRYAWSCCGRPYLLSSGRTECCNTPTRETLSECFSCGGKGYTMRAVSQDERGGVDTDWLNAK